MCVSKLPVDTEPCKSFASFHTALCRRSVTRLMERPTTPYPALPVPVLAVDPSSTMWCNSATCSAPRGSTTGPATARVSDVLHTVVCLSASCQVFCVVHAVPWACFGYSMVQTIHIWVPFEVVLRLYRSNGCAAHGSAVSKRSALTRHIFISDISRKRSVIRELLLYEKNCSLYSRTYRSLYSGTYRRGIGT